MFFIRDGRINIVKTLLEFADAASQALNLRRMLLFDMRRDRAWVEVSNRKISAMGMLRSTRAYSPHTLGCFASLDGYLICVSAYSISSRDPTHDRVNIRKTNHWDKSPHTHVWCRYHKGPVVGAIPRAEAITSQTPHPSRTISTRTFRSHLQLESSESLSKKRRE